MQGLKLDRAARIASDRGRMIRRALSVKEGYLTGSEAGPEAVEEIIPHVMADLLHLLVESGGTIDKARFDGLALQAFTYFDTERRPY